MNDKGSEDSVKVEFFEVGPLRVHALHRFLPGPDRSSAEWHGFVDGLSAAGPAGIPPLYVTAEGWILDGERRWLAARQLGWLEVPVVVREEWEAATLMVESLLGQRSLSKGAKVYLSLSLMEEYSKAAHIRRLAWLQKGRKIAEKPNVSPLAYSVGQRRAADALAERLGCSGPLVEQAIRIRRYFDLPGVREHKFEFQDGREMTLREYWEPKILDAKRPVGFGEVLKGIGWFVDENGQPLNHPPPDRNSHLFYFERAWQGWAKQCQRWDGLSEADRGRAVAVVAEAAREVPGEVLAAAGKVFKAEMKRRKKVENRAGVKGLNAATQRRSDAETKPAPAAIVA